MAATKTITIGLDKFQMEQLKRGNAMPEILEAAGQRAKETLNDLIDAELMHEQCRGELRISIEVEHVQPDAAETVSPPG